MKRRLLLTTLFASTLGCGGSSAQSSSTTVKELSAVMSRVDVPRLLQCTQAGEPIQVAKCLGARALTEGLEEAIHRATTLAEDGELASNPMAGADDLSDADKRALAGQLDAALEDLAVQIAATQQ